MAFLDWPPPPSPGMQRQAPSLGAGAGRGRRKRAPSGEACASPALDGTVSSASGTLAAAAASATAPEGSSSDEKFSTRAAEIRARGELWNLRAEIEQNKVRSVVPFPFFGRAMRFEDDFSALQITDDGRFSYSHLSFEAPNGADGSSAALERGTGSAVSDRQVVVTYEGVLVTTSNPDVEETTAEERESQEAHAIEGRGLVRHEVKGTRLTHVEKGVYRFAITVSPFYQPTDATVHPLLQPTSPGRLPHRKRQLPYVGAGRKALACQQPRRYPRAKFTPLPKVDPRRTFSHGDLGASSSPSSPLLAAGSLATGSPGGRPTLGMTRLPPATGSLKGSASMPALLEWDGRSPKAQDGKVPSIGEYRQYYDQRFRAAFG